MYIDSVTIILIVLGTSIAVYYSYTLLKIKRKRKLLKEEYINMGGKINDLTYKREQEKISQKEIKKKDVTHKKIGRLVYFISTSLMWIVLLICNSTLGTSSDSLTFFTFLSIGFLVIGYELTKRRIRDTSMNYKWRYLYFVGGIGILLMVYLYFKKSK